MARVLFVEPFMEGSHAAFADGLRERSRHEIVVLSLPGGEWRRRMRRGAQELAALSPAVTGAFDAMIVTDMLDLPVFLALTRPRFERVPVLAYFHENQFTYPRLRGTKFNSWFGQQNYLTALAADRVAFNSAFHRDDFLGALRALAGEPNNWLVPEAIAAIEAKSRVLPVGVDLEPLLAPGRPRQSGPPIVLWNHRWEFDKAPELFARTLLRLASEGVGFRLALAGDPGPNPAPELLELAAALEDRVVQRGLVESRAAYVRLLRESAVVVSTSRHEFFGVGTIEAIAAGCLPLLPWRQNYPALVPAELHDRLLWRGEADFEEKLRCLIAEPPFDLVPVLRAQVRQYDWGTVVADWDAALERLVAGRPGS